MTARTQETDSEPAHETNTKRKYQQGFKKGDPRPARKSDRWEGNLPESFYNWLEDIQPRILTRSGRYEVFQPTEAQKELIEAIFTTDSNGNLEHSLILDCEPRRHGKSTVYALVCLFLFTARKNQNIALLGNTEQHSQRVQFNPLVRIIKNTPELKKRITDKMIYLDSIRDDLHGNYIQKVGVSMSTAFGERINVLWVSDFHACPDLGPFNALQASLLDSEDSMILIDSNVDAYDGPVHEIEKEAENDSSIYARHIEYADFEEYCQKAPAWIDRKKAARLRSTTLPVDFERDILGKRSSAVNALFPPHIIEICKDSYRIPITDITQITKGRAFKIGGGLDRAKNLIAGPNGDHTVWTCVMKVANPDGWEPLYYVLNQVKFTINSSREIKKAILEDHQRYHLDNVILENYEVVDLQSWMGEQKISCELITAHDTVQNASFPELHRIAKEGRLIFPEALKELASEMSTFVYTQRQPGKYSFGHSSQKFHDDHVYSLNWAIFSLRSHVLDLYTIDSVICSNLTNKRPLCFMMGGNLVLHCAEHCHAYQEIEDQFRQFKSFSLDSELTVPEFFKSFVKVQGCIQYQGV